MSSGDDINRLLRRSARERQARLEAEEIASSHLSLLNEANQLLQIQLEQLNSLTSELTEKLAKAEEAAASAVHEVLWQIGADLSSAEHDDAEAVLGRVLESAGEACGAAGSGIWRLHRTGLRLERLAQWRRTAEGEFLKVPPIQPVEVGEEILAKIAAASEGSVLTYQLADALSDQNLHRIKDSRRVMVRAGVFSVMPDSVMVVAIAAPADHAAAVKADPLIRGLMILLAQFISKTTAETALVEAADRHLRNHVSMTNNAARIISSTGDNFDELVELALADTADLLGVPSVTDWTVDYEERAYVRGQRLREDPATDEQDRKIPFGASELLDEARTSASTTLRESISEDSPKKLAVPRGDSGHPSSILMIEAEGSYEFQVVDVEALERMSETLLLVQNRIEAEARTTASLERSPIPIVLRRQQNLEVIRCNEAFAKMLGWPSTASLMGTLPPDVLFQDLADVDHPFRSSSAWMFDQVANSPLELTGDGTTQLQVYRGPQGRPILARIRCVAVSTGHTDPFVLIHVLDITESRRAELRLEFLAEHDELTGLLNRRGLRRRLSEMQSREVSSALIFLDLDGFKYINDSLGHEMGNHVLRKIAERAKVKVDSGSALARLGGDEFALALQGPISQEDTQDIVQDLIDEIGSVMELGEHRYFPSLSAGITFFAPETNIEETFVAADAAMYSAKRTGGRQLAFYDKGLQEVALRRLELESDLRNALVQGEFTVHYQPEVSISDARIVGAEALVRWRHPERGLLVAGQFIDRAEDVGLTGKISDFVLEEACAEAQSWLSSPEAPTLRVNLAASQICDEEELIVSHVARVLEKTGLPAPRLCLEITETALIRDLDRAVHVLTELKKLGVQLALDDFGTGYSSLSYLKRFEVDALKIDKSFVNDLSADIESWTFVDSILSLARALGLDVVAEGIETQEQATILRDLGCVRAQGYLYHKPMSAAEIRSLLEDQEYGKGTLTRLATGK